MWFHKNGKTDRVGNIKDDMYHGPFVKYYENGNKEQEVIWDNDDIINIIDYDENGQIIEK